MARAYLIMQDGSVYEGQSIGSTGQIVGKIIPYNGITGYQEILSDPSYFGDLVCMTYPIIGSVGVWHNTKSKEIIRAGGVIVREANNEPFSVSADKIFHHWLAENHCVGIQCVDTRSIMRRIMARGIMTAVITSVQNPDIAALIKLSQTYIQEDTVKKVTARKAELYGSEKNKNSLIAVIDMGMSQKEKDALISRGVNLIIFPYNTSSEVILSSHPDAIYISNGPDPCHADRLIVAESLRRLIGSKPIFAAGNGHLVLAEAYGLCMQALKNGHHGVNYPVRDQIKNTTYITTQNHSSEVIRESFDSSGDIIITHININDGSVEGIRYAPDVTSVQFVPDLFTQGFNTGYIWDQFLACIR